MSIKIINHKDISRVIINEPKTYNSVSFKNLTDLIKVQFLKSLATGNKYLNKSKPSSLFSPVLTYIILFFLLYIEKTQIINTYVSVIKNRFLKQTI